MLLIEIKRPEVQSLPQGTRRLRPEQNKQRYKLVGSGIGAGVGMEHSAKFDSRVYLDKKHPNQVLKVVPIHDKEDPYLQYVRMIQQHQTNPFFPKIYGIRLYDIPGGTHGSDELGNDYYAPDHILLHVWMERLHPVTELDPEHVYQLLSDVGVDYRGRLKDDLSLRSLFSQTFRQYPKKYTQHPKFKEALRLLEPMIRKFGQDMHIENIMVRLTSVGPQLVIVDPLWPPI